MDKGCPVSTSKSLDVAILVSTYNGRRFIEYQIDSLNRNTTRFTLHWLDDHSTDNTRETVRAAALRAGIELREWHQVERLGVPGAFFSLLERVEADIYLFCDQDDIWQPGKIDAAVRNLLPDLAAPVLCFTDPFMFREESPETLYRSTQILGATAEAALRESRAFMPCIIVGHTQAFTRPLRELFMRHKEIARTHALMHDTWMYLIAAAGGVSRLVPNAPTTLYRQHQHNSSGKFCSWKGRGMGRFAITRRQHQLARQRLARQAQGFILASETLPPGPKLERILNIARMVATIDRRQSPVQLFQLSRRGVLMPSTRLALGLAVACLCSDANA